jgi:hypothetical protein
MLAEHGLAESARIVSRAFNGDQDAIAQAMGRMEAMKAVVSLTGDTYSEFAAEFGSTMDGITARSQAIQTQSYESKLARLGAATAALQIKTGESINGIKGIFADMGTVFLTHIVAPIVNSPVGPVFTNLAAVTGLAAKGVLDVGSGIINAAAQFSVLAVNVQNAGGFMHLFGSSLNFLGAPFKAAGTMIVGLVGNLFGIGGSSAVAGTGALGVAGAGAAGGIGAAGVATGGFAAALWAAVWPVGVVVLAIGALVLGGYLLVKNWSAVSGFFINLWNKVTGTFSAAFNWIKNLLGGVPNSVLAVAAAFFPFIGIPLLVVKNWDAIPGFFTSLWSKITGAFSAAFNGIKNFFTSLPNWVIGLAAVFVPFISIPVIIVRNWGAIKNFFASLWSGIGAGVSEFTGWLRGVWSEFTGWLSGAWDGASASFSAAWGRLYGYFSGIWEKCKGPVLDFVEWLKPVTDVILAPFKGIGFVLGKIGGWFRGEESSLSEDINTGLNRDVTGTVTSAAGTAISGTEPPLTETLTSAVAPSFAAPVMPPPPVPAAAPGMAAGTVTALSGSRWIGDSPEMSYAASGAFADAISGTALSSGVDLATIDEELGRSLKADTPAQNISVSLPRENESRKRENITYRTRIEHLAVNADDFEDAYDFIRQLSHMVHKPEEAAV